MKIIATKTAPEAIGPYSQAIVINGMVYTSGQIALDPATGAMATGGVEAEARQVFSNVKNLLEAAGSSTNLVVKTTLFLANMDDFATVNAIYAEFFGSHKPARSTVAVKTLPKNALVECEVVALLAQ